MIFDYNDQKYNLQKYGPSSISKSFTFEALEIDKRRTQTVALVKNKLNSEEKMVGFGIQPSYSDSFYSP